MLDPLRPKLARNQPTVLRPGLPTADVRLNLLCSPPPLFSAPLSSPLLPSALFSRCFNRASKSQETVGLGFG